MPPTHLVVLLTLLLCCDGVYIYSSFWAPLYNRRILNYRVDVPFDPTVSASAREQYERNYGFRGGKLIEDLGNGKVPSSYRDGQKMYGDVKFYYT